MDISDPDTCDLISVCYHPGYGVNVALYDHYAYVAADNSGGLFVIDIEDPTNMELLDTGFGGNYYGIAVAGAYAYAVTSTELKILELADPADPTLIASCPGQAACRNLTVRDDYAYVVGNGLEIFDISNPFTPTSVGCCDLPGYARDIFLWENFAYIAANFAGLRVFDISDPSAPVEVAFYDTPGQAWGVAADGPIIYLADSSCFGVYQLLGVPMIRITGPNGGEHWSTAETHSITWESPGVQGNVTIRLNRDYPSGAWEALFTNIPSSGSMDWTVTGPRSDHCRMKIECVDDNSICDTSHADFSIIRGSLELRPDTLSFGEVPLDSAVCEFFWLINRGADTLIVDSILSDHPAFVVINDPWYEVAPNESLIVVACYSPPDTLWHVGWITVHSSAGDSTVFCTGRGVIIDDAAPARGLPTEYRLFPAYPNPFNSATTIEFVVPRASHVVIRAFDLLGREAAMIADDVMMPGVHRTEWQCGTCASGMYIVTMSADGFRGSQKVMLLR